MTGKPTDHNLERLTNDESLAVGLVRLKRVIICDEDGNPLDRAATATLSNVGDSASSVSLLAANADRKGFIIHNDSAAILYLKFGTSASTSSYTYKVNPQQTVEMTKGTIYTGIIHGIWASDAGGNARVTELSV